MFSFEAGRRCDSGPGNFTFDTKQGNEIFLLVDQAIQSQKAQAEDRHLSGSLNFDPDCPTSLQHIRNPGGVSGDSSSSSSREADNDSGGSKPGSADGVLGKREVGDGGGGRGQGGGSAGCLKGRSLPEPPAMLGVLGGGGTPPRSPRSHAAAKASPEEHTGLYSEPADSVRLPLQMADCLYSDPVDSIKVQNPSGNPSTLPVPTPRLRPAGDESFGGGQGDHHSGINNRNSPDVYSHVYDRISLELNQKASALSLNGAVGGGKGGARGVKPNRRPPGGQAEGALSLPALTLEHIYDEPEGCAKVNASIPSGLGMSIYDEARLEPASLKRQEEVLGPEGSYNTPSTGKLSEPPQLGPSRGTAQPLRLPKPVTAPKPARGVFARKEPMPLPSEKKGGPGSNVNNNNNIWGGGVDGGEMELYSRVAKQKPPPAKSWYSKYHQVALRSPDIIYDNLGDI